MSAANVAGLRCDCCNAPELECVWIDGTFVCWYCYTVRAPLGEVQAQAQRCNFKFDPKPLVRRAVERWLKERR